MQNRYALSFASKTLLVVLLIFFCLSCSKDEPNQEQETETFNLANNELRPLQIVSVYLGEENLSSAEFYGSLGDEEITLKRINSNTLSFAIPANTPAGSTEVEVSINGKGYSAQATILDNVSFNDPKDVFSEYYQQLSTDEFFNYDQQKLNSAMAKFQALSEEDQLLAAQTLLNNKVILDQLANAIKDFYALEGPANAAPGAKMLECDAVCVTGTAVAVVGLAIASAPGLAAASVTIEAISLGIFIGAVGEAVYDALNVKTEGLIVRLKDSLAKAYDTSGTDWMAETYETSLEPYIRLYTKQQEPSGRISLREKETLHLSIKLNSAPFISEGNREKYPIVGQLLDGISKLQDLLKGIYEIPRPREEVKKEYPENLEGFTVSVDNPDVEVSELSGTPEDASVFFQTDKLEDQNFTFTYSYTNEEGETTSLNQNMKLDLDYFVTSLSGASLPTPLELQNNTPKALKIVDWEGEDLEDFDISKLSIQNISSNKLEIHSQTNGSFAGESSGEYFEIIPLTDEEEVETSFDIVYDGVNIQTIQAIIEAQGNGFYIEDVFYPLEQGFVDYQCDEDNGCTEEDLRAEYFGHELQISASGYTTETSSFGEISVYSTDYMFEFGINSDFSDSIRDGSYSVGNENFKFGGALVLNLENGWQNYSALRIVGGNLEIENDGNFIIFVFVNLELEDGRIINGRFKGEFLDAGI